MYVAALLLWQCFLSVVVLGQQGPAVSAANGKFEFDAGALNGPATGGFMFRAAGAFTFPVTDMFGIQADITATNDAGGLGFGGALHAFTRDPENYLLGATAGAYRVNGALLLAAGPEAELYLDRVSLEAWGGLAGLTYDNPAIAGRAGAFLLADVGFYPTDDFRVSAGIGTVVGHNSLHLDAEYLFHNAKLPFSVAADVRFGQDGSIAATIGLRGFIGGRDKSLIARHRQDDPPSRGADLGSAAGASLRAGMTKPTGTTNEGNVDIPSLQHKESEGAGGNAGDEAAGTGDEGGGNGDGDYECLAGQADCDWVPSGNQDTEDEGVDEDAHQCLPGQDDCDS